MISNTKKHGNHLKQKNSVNLEEFYLFLKTNPVPYGIGYLKSHKTILTPEQKQQATNDILRWAEKIKNTKIQTMGGMIIWM